jgi:hypothetical protein
LKSLYSAIKDGFVKPSVAFDFGHPENAVSEEDKKAVDAVSKKLFEGTPFADGADADTGDESDGVVND